eukprot:268467-Hanusia_phi.AAC.1
MLEQQLVQAAKQVDFCYDCGILMPHVKQMKIDKNEKNQKQAAQSNTLSASFHFTIEAEEAPTVVKESKDQSESDEEEEDEDEDEDEDESSDEEEDDTQVGPDALANLTNHHRFEHECECEYRREGHPTQTQRPAPAGHKLCASRTDQSAVRLQTVTSHIGRRGLTCQTVVKSTLMSRAAEDQLSTKTARDVE